MPAATGVAASHSPSAGEAYIFQGGGTWHRYSGSPLTGGEWTWPASGTSANNIYIGVDVNWFSGSSFARPIMNQDNPLSTAVVSNCQFPVDGTTFVSFSGKSQVVFDNFEFTGKCWSGSSVGQTIQAGTATVMSNLYIHGWTVASSASDDNHFMIGPAGGQGQANAQNRYLYLVIDGADSSLGAACNSPSCVGSFGGSGGATGWAMDDCWDVEYSVIRHVSNGLECGDIGILHDNLFEYQFEPSFGGRHGNVVETIPGGFGNLCKTGMYYNNITRNTNEGVDWWIQCSSHIYFNNVWENSGHFPPDPNGLMISPPGGSGSSVISVFVYNNTFDGTVKAQAGPGNSSTPTAASGSTFAFENNHILGFTSISGFFSCSSGNTCSITDNGGEVFQTISAANTQGYTLTNNYAPTLSTNATVGQGVNASSSCSTFSPDSALCSGTTGAVIKTSGNGGFTAVLSGIPVNPRGTSWDAGAYQFSSAAGSSTRPNPPTNLLAIVK